jgi:hypothetical protein
MNQSRGAALETALAYHQAWPSGDFELAMTYIVADIVCEAPAGRLDGAEAFGGFMGRSRGSSSVPGCSRRSMTMKLPW